MSSRRTARVGEAIREVVATAILFDVKDPRVANVTVLGCDVSGDLRHCKVRVSIMGDDVKRRTCLHGLISSAGFLQRRIADRLQLRYTPILAIVEDDSVKKSIEVSRLLREANARSSPTEEVASEEAGEEDEFSDELDSDQHDLLDDDGKLDPLDDSPSSGQDSKPVLEPEKRLDATSARDEGTDSSSPK